ncbi:MAG: hypothetical protein WBQ41_04465 [Solirubrobacterales bacterium]
MEEAKATYCFCGCGTRVSNPRLVVTNTNGWELADELAQWTKVELMMGATGQSLSGDLANNVEQGQILWLKLSDSIHAAERADREDEMRAAAWRKHAKKARKKLRRSLRRDGLPNPFEFPDLSATELSAWINEDRPPDWASEALERDEAADQERAGEDAAEEEAEAVYSDEAAARENTATEEDIPFQLITSAMERMSDRTWEFDEGPGAVIWQTSDRLTSFREDMNLFLDAAGMGYWVAVKEQEISGDLVTFDSDYTAKLREIYERDPEDAILIAMTQVADDLPAPFSFGAEVWDQLMVEMLMVLRDRWPRILELGEGFDQDTELEPEHAEFAVKLGYGLSHAIRALEITGTRPRQD